MGSRYWLIAFALLVAAVFYIISLLFGSCGGVVRQAFPGRHLEA